MLPRAFLWTAESVLWLSYHCPYFARSLRRAIPFAHSRVWWIQIFFPECMISSMHVYIDLSPLLIQVYLDLQSLKESIVFMHSTAGSEPQGVNPRLELMFRLRPASWKVGLTNPWRSIKRVEDRLRSSRDHVHFLYVATSIMHSRDTSSIRRNSLGM